MAGAGTSWSTRSRAGSIHRQGKAPTNFARTLPAAAVRSRPAAPQGPLQLRLPRRSAAEAAERDLERGLLEHIRALSLSSARASPSSAASITLEVGGEDFYLDLLFYHLRLRCFVVIELKIEEFKPEFAGKMNFYLSAVDDLLRHPDDAPSIGMILCKGRNAMVAEYALRDTAKPMGVAEYRLSPALPAQLQADLPTAEEFAREFALMSLVELRIEVERELRDAAVGARHEAGTSSIGEMLRQLGPDAALWEAMPEIEAALRTLNEAVHGIAVEPQALKKPWRMEGV